MNRIKLRLATTLVIGAACTMAAGCRQSPISQIRNELHVPEPVAAYSAARSHQAGDLHVANAGQQSNQPSRGEETAPTFIQTVQHLPEPAAELLPPSFGEQPITFSENAKAPQPLVDIAGMTAIVEKGPRSVDEMEIQQRDIDFKTALQLAGGQNPQVAFAGARIDEAAAQWRAARLFWLPDVRAGVSANKHEGPLQESGGRVLDVSRTSLQAGAGVSAIGAGTPMVPGLSVRFRTVDAIFEKRIAEQTLFARQSRYAATINDLLFETASAYLNLLNAVKQRVIAEETLQNTNDLYKTTKSFADTGQGPVADADRARTEQTLRMNDITRTDEAIQVASARLAQLLRLDPSVFLNPADPFLMEIELVSLGHPVRELIAIGLSNRPELQENQQLASAAIQRLRREKFAPFLPSVLLGVSYSSFGGGRGGNVDHMQSRFDVDAAAFWEIRNFGFGEKVQRDIAETRVQQANIRGLQLMDQVSREVVEAFTQAQARRKQISIAKSAVVAAKQSYDRNRQRIRNGQGLPLELLQSIQALDQAQREYLRAVTEYNRAQFQLYRAIGRQAAP